MRLCNRKKVKLTDEIIRMAILGNEEAEEAIFDYYEPYIIKLSRVPYVNNSGRLKYEIDKDIYMSLKLKLHKLIMDFKIA